jgi:hypothetical protein
MARCCLLIIRSGFKSSIAIKAGSYYFYQVNLHFSTEIDLDFAGRNEYIHSTKKEKVDLMRRSQVKIVCAFLILLALVSVHYNVAVNGHFHTTENGSIVFHAHPFESTNKTATSKPGHTHTNHSLLNYEILTSLIFVLILFCITLFIPLVTDCLIVFASIVISAHFFRSVFHRGPPFSLFQN